MPLLHGKIQKIAKGEKNRQLSGSHIQGIDPEGTANIDAQLPAYQKSIEESGHQKAKHRAVPHPDIPQQPHRTGSQQRGCAAQKGIQGQGCGIGQNPIDPQEVESLLEKAVADLRGKSWMKAPMQPFGPRKKMI